jgi:hypothetical protein
MVDALVALGYPFGDLRRMTYTDLSEWLEAATANRSSQNNSGA